MKSGHGDTGPAIDFSLHIDEFISNILDNRFLCNLHSTAMAFKEFAHISLPTRSIETFWGIKVPQGTNQTVVIFLLRDRPLDGFCWVIIFAFSFYGLTRTKYVFTGM